jgi:beta-glucosidase/6-phospho-beta-glucosidase/beta-galactosidase
MPFVVATGIECSAPTIAGGVRRDELLLTDHWNRVEEDLDLVVELGISHLRYGIPFHVVAAEPGRLDWRWTDRAMAAIRDRPIEPIVDLLHFGVPDGLTGFGDPRLVDRYVEYVRAFVERYRWVRWYTPVNEPVITATYSAAKGYWNELRSDDRSFVAALENAVTCAVRGTEIIRVARPDAVFLQSDACEAFTPADADDPASVAAATHLTERGFLGFDLTYGRAPSARMRAWLLANGLSEERLDWFLAHGSDAGAIVGLDYYAGNERRVTATGAELPGAAFGLGALARAFHTRYGRPVMLAETNRVSELAGDWLRETWNDLVAAERAGVPVAGYCWYSLTDQVDWDTCLAEANDRVNSLGLVDLERRRRPVAGIFEALARETAATGIAPFAPLADVEPEPDPVAERAAA